ncbi:MAG: Rnf-Nqr domain containing protein [Oscillospiraceae bacterium]|nr:Rnf-Nqr domain containing protein [Oscillospiraceae bacterium]MDD4413470.1 Rnf-Nqr domain containing protein [Oscillospiraceae bacterium]
MSNMEIRKNKRPSSRKPAELRNVFFDAFLANNIVLIQAIGITPIVAAGVTLQNGVALTLCTAAVLLPASLFLSYIGDRLPSWIRAPLYMLGAIIILLGASILIDRLISQQLYANLYIFLPLTAVNSLVLYRAGGFSVSHEPVAALTEAIASSLGFGLVICVVSALREIASYGTLWSVPINSAVKLSEAALPYAAFLLLGFMAAFLQWLKTVLERRT